MAFNLPLLFIAYFVAYCEYWLNNTKTKSVNGLLPLTPNAEIDSSDKLFFDCRLWTVSIVCIVPNTIFAPTSHSMFQVNRWHSREKKFAWKNTYSMANPRFMQTRLLLCELIVFVIIISTDLQVNKIDVKELKGKIHFL